MKKSLVGITTFIALLAAFLTGPVSPANADPLASDANLTALTFGSQNYFDYYGRRDSSGIYPGFNKDITTYQIATVADTLDVNATLSDPLATMKVTIDGVTGTALSATPYTVTLEPKVSMLDIEVTAQDGVTKKHYKVNISNQVLATPELVSISTNTGPWIGGKPITVRVKNINLGNAYTEGHTAVTCYAMLMFTSVDPKTKEKRVSNSWINYNQETAPTTDSSGVTTLATMLPSSPITEFTGSAEVSIANRCDGLMRSSNDWAYMGSESPATADFAYSESVTVDSAEHPSTLTSGSSLTLRGSGLYAAGGLSVRVKDSASNEYLEFWGYPNSSMKPGEPGVWGGLLDMYNRPASFKVAGKKTLEAGFWRYDPVADTSTFVHLLTKTVNWKPVAASSVSISPAKSDIAGGKRVKVSGYNLCNQSVWPNAVEVKIDGKPLTNIQYQNGDWCGEVIDYLTGKPLQQWVTGLVPEGTSTGVKTVTVDNGNGAVKVAATFVYGATPEITAFSETSVAATGGSRLTITGNNFGLSGTPTVTIGGKKAPKVVRVSDDELTVTVPADLTLGAQLVTVISSSGGGANTTPATIDAVASTQNPTVGALSSTEGLTSGGETLTIAVGNVASPNTVGVMFGLNHADVVSASASSIEVKVPAGSAGAVSVTVSSATGQAIVANAYTYKPIAAVKSVSPSTVASTADEAGRTVTITGLGFGASGTLKVGQQAAQAYTSTDSGTKISGIVIPNDLAGSLSILITPQGSSTPLAASVRVTKPSFTYVGTEAELALFNTVCTSNDWSCIFGYIRGRASFSKDGGDVLKIKGSGFGTAGTVRVGTQTLVADSYSDTMIRVVLPALAEGAYDLTVVPSSGLPTETRTGAFTSVATLATSDLVINAVVPTVPNTRGDSIYNFDPSQDTSSVFKVTGKGFLGADNGASTKVYQLDAWTDPRIVSAERVQVTVLSITDTEITFSAVRTYAPVRWTGVAVETSLDLTYVRHAIHYVGNPPPTASISSWYGLCTKDAINSHNPAVVNVTGQGMFGSAGSVNLSGQAIDPAAVTWTADGVTVDFSKLPADLAEHWGQKSLEFIPSDTGLISRSFNWFCGVWAEVETKINGSTSEITIQAGSDFVATADIPSSKRLNEIVPDIAWPAGGYQYQSAADHARTYTWTYGVRDGLPTYAGDWYIRANPGTTTQRIDRGIYAGVSASEVHVLINGTPIAFTPKLKGSTETSIIYRGQLGDGSGDTTEDIEYTLDVAAGAPEITKIVWEYRNHACGQNNPDYNWTEGLPANVAVVFNDCGGDGTTISSWDIRVKSFEMLKDGKDQAMFYLPTYNVFNLTVEKRALTIDKVTASKPYDGNANIALGALTVTGALDGETPTLQGNEGRNGYFADASVGENKPVYVAGSDGQTDFIQRIKLEGAFDWNYYLTNGELLVLGSITKANARLSLSATTQSLVMSVVEESTITATVIDTATGNAPIAAAGASDVVLTVATPSVCSISAERVVTALAPGECIVQASQAASTNYNAASASSDPESTTETLTITVFAEPKKVSVITQDLTIGQGDAVNPSYEVVGLADGDGLDSVVFDYYDGATKLDAAPTQPGRYTVVPSSANIVTTNAAAYDASIEFVPGVLIVTSPPPTVTGMTPTNGAEAGGETVVITGTNLSDVSSIRFGSTVIANTGFSVNGDATEISFAAPAGTGNVTVVLVAGESELSLDYSYDPPIASVNEMSPVKGYEAGGELVTITGTHLELVTEVRFGTTSLTGEALTRSQDGTTIAFNAPAGTGKVTVVAVASTGNTSFEYTYDSAPPIVPDAVQSLSLLNPNFGAKFSGHLLKMQATNLKPGSTYEINMYSHKVTMATGTVGIDGAMNISMPVPASACAKPGLHRMILDSVDGNGKPVRSMFYVVLGAKCVLNAVLTQNADKSWSVAGMRFDYQKWELTAASKSTLKSIKYWMRNASHVKVSGYTETDGKGKALQAINKLLAKKRAQTTVNHLKSLGLKSRFWVNPVGAKLPVSKVQSKNRRVELTVRF